MNTRMEDIVTLLYQFKYPDTKGVGVGMKELAFKEYGLNPYFNSIANALYRIPPLTDYRWQPSDSKPEIHIAPNKETAEAWCKTRFEPQTPDGYFSLREVLNRAFEQASKGKGKERHAQGLPFNQQPMQVISNLIGSQDGMYYQAIKKIQESTRLPSKERQVAELLGAIIYIAGAIINLESK